jgi:hypothetical protein
MNRLVHFTPEPFEDSWLELEAPRARVAGPQQPIRARILWPALGFPAVIAPKDPPAQNFMLDADHTRCICVLLLSDRKYMSKEEAARYLRYVPWAERGRRHIPPGQTGSFNEFELDVKNDVFVHPGKQDAFGIWIAFGGDRDGNHAVSVNLAKAVKDFYSHPQRGMEYLQEIRISEAASGRLRDAQYHLFWNNELPNEQTSSDEMTVLIRDHARPLREKLGNLWKRFSTYLLAEYEFEYGAIHPPYSSAKSVRQGRTEILHPLFVQRGRTGALKIAHVTDAHVHVRADVYEENLNRKGVELEEKIYPSRWMKGSDADRNDSNRSYNNWNRSFVAVYKHAQRISDVVLLTGDLIDYGRGHWGLPARDRLGDDSTYHEDRNWFLFYYLLASGDAYQRPVYTILGNHDWRLNPYPPHAPGARFPEAFINNYTVFSAKERQDIIDLAHGPGFDTQYSYNINWKTKLKTLASFIAQTQSLDQEGLPTETKLSSVLWYLYCVNPFFDYYFSLPTGQDVLMLDWGKDENVLFPIAERGGNWPYLWQAEKAAYPGPKAKRCLSDRQWAFVNEFVDSPGQAKIIGIHAPPIGPYPDWSDSDLRSGRKIYEKGSTPRGQTNAYATQFPDGTKQFWNGHPLFAVRPNSDQEGVEADYNSFERLRPDFLKKVRGAKVRFVFSGHIHRSGLYSIDIPAARAGNGVAGKLLIKAQNEQPGGRSRVLPPAVGTVPNVTIGPLFVNTTSAGPRGHSWPAPNQPVEVEPGYTYAELASDGSIQAVNFIWPLRGAIPVPASSSVARHELEVSPIRNGQREWAESTAIGADRR